MIIKGDKYIVEIEIDETYTVDSMDNRKYDYIFNTEGYKRSDFYKALSISVSSENEGYSIVLVGDYYSYDMDSALLEGDALIVLQNHLLTKIDLKSRQIIKKIQISNSCGIAYAIFKEHDKYIIIGELDVLGLDSDFAVEWVFSGKDAFSDYEMCRDCIWLTDFENEKYRIDFNGKEI